MTDSENMERIWEDFTRIDPPNTSSTENPIIENVDKSPSKEDENSSIRNDFRLINGNRSEDGGDKTEEIANSSTDQSQNLLSTDDLLPEGISFDDLVEVEQSPESLTNQEDSQDKQLIVDENGSEENQPAELDKNLEATEKEEKTELDENLESTKEEFSLIGNVEEDHELGENLKSATEKESLLDVEEIGNENSSNVQLEKSPKSDASLEKDDENEVENDIVALGENSRSSMESEKMLLNDSQVLTENDSDDDIIELDVNPSTSKVKRSVDAQQQLLDKLLLNSRSTSSTSAYKTQYIDVDCLKPDFSISLFSESRVKDFVEMLQNETFLMNETIFKIHPLAKNPSKFQVFSGSHRLMAIKEWNASAETPIDKIKCQVYPTTLSCSERVTCLTSKEAFDDNYFTLGHRAEIIRQLYAEKGIKDRNLTKTECREIIQRMYEKTFPKSKYHIVIGSFVFLSKNHWEIVKDVMQKFENGLIMQYSDRPNNSKYKGEHGKPEICASFFLDFFRGYKLKPDLSINVLRSMEGTEKSLTWALERFKSLGHTLKETLEDLKIIGYDLENPPDIHRASMFFVGRLMNEQELCECLRNPKTLGKIKRRMIRPASLIAENLKSQMSSSAGFSASYSSISNIKTVSSRAILIFEHYEFEELFSKILGKFVAIFIGDQDYLNYVKEMMGDPHLTVETRINSPKPMVYPQYKPSNINSGVYIYLMETQLGRLYPNRELFHRMIWDFQISLSSFMLLNELANPVQLTSPKQLLVINPPSNLANEIFTLGRNIRTLSTVEIVCDSEAEASQMAMQIQKICLDESQGVKKKPSELNAGTSNSIIDISDDEIDASLQKPNKLSIELIKKKSSDCQDFKIRCSPPKFPTQLQNLSNNSRKRPLNSQILAGTPNTSNVINSQQIKSQHKRVYHVTHQRHSQPSSSKSDTSETPNIANDTDEIQQFCDKCGVIGPITSNGLCEPCHIKEFGKPRQDKSQKHPCIGCNRIRLVFKRGYCRKCFSTTKQKISTGKEVECNRCSKVKKPFSRGMCAACYQRYVTRPKMLAKKNAEKSTTQEKMDKTLTMEELLNLCETSFVNTTQEFSVSGEGPSQKQPRLADDLFSSNVLVEMEEDSPCLNPNELLLKM